MKYNQTRKQNYIVKGLKRFKNTPELKKLRGEIYEKKFGR